MLRGISLLISKRFNREQCLLAMLEKWKKSVNNGKAFGTLLMDLMNAFDFSDHDILIVKLNAYGFSMLALKLIHDYLSSEKQRMKINSS